MLYRHRVMVVGESVLHHTGIEIETSGSIGTVIGTEREAGTETPTEISAGGKVGTEKTQRQYRTTKHLLIIRCELAIFTTYYLDCPLTA